MNKLISEKDEEKLADYDRLKLEYTRLHEDYRRLQGEKDRQFAIRGVSNTFKAKIETEISVFKTKLKDINDDVEMSFTQPDQWTEEINLIKGYLDGLNTALNYC